MPSYTDGRRLHRALGDVCQCEISAQRLAYSVIMIGGVAMIGTGVALWFGKRFPWTLTIFGGFHIALIIHVVQVMRAGVPTLLGMITGSLANRPSQTRHALAWSGSIMAVLIAALVISSPDGRRINVPGR